jgi:hypothetical protein
MVKFCLILFIILYLKKAVVNYYVLLLYYITYACVYVQHMSKRGKVVLCLTN